MYFIPRLFITHDNNNFIFLKKKRYNIQYGRLSAEDADIISAAKQADIHSRILTFPNGYDTEVCIQHHHHHYYYYLIFF